MEILLKKLSVEERSRLAVLLEEADRLITGSDSLTEEEVGDTYEKSTLKKAVSEVMYDLGIWC